MSQFSIYLLMLAVTTTVLQGVIVEQKYKRWWSNCSSIDTFVTKPASSLVACALFCTKSSACKSFAWVNDTCGLMDTCPRYCSPATEETNAWDVNIPKGKIYLESKFLI